MKTMNVTSHHLPELSLAPASVPASSLPPLDTESPGLLARLERQLRSGRCPLPTKAKALATIKALGLTRLHGLSFPTYCGQRLRLKKSRIHQLLEFADMLAVTTLGGLAPGDNERQLRPLKQVPRAGWSDIWGEVLRTAPQGRITGKHAQAVVDARLARQHAAERPAPPVAQVSTTPVIASDPVNIHVAMPSTTPAPPAQPDRFVPTVPAAEIKLPGWKPAWQKLIREAPRPPATHCAGFFSWQPAD